MTTLKDEALAYELQRTLNVAELPKIPIDTEIFEKIGEDEDGKSYSFRYITLNGQQYRIPKTVLDQVKTILKLRPEIKFVKVDRTGIGKATRYTTEITE